MAAAELLLRAGQHLLGRKLAPQHLPEPLRKAGFQLSAKAAVADVKRAEFLAVQGVIDLIIEDENGDLLLYDYKTDRLTPAELLNDSLVREKMTERHAPQLKYYKEAVRRLFGKECKASFVYSTHAAKEFEI